MFSHSIIFILRERDLDTLRHVHLDGFYSRNSRSPVVLFRTLIMLFSMLQCIVSYALPIYEIILLSPIRYFGYALDVVQSPLFRDEPFGRYSLFRCFYY